MPAWISSGFSEYAKRLPKNYQLILIEISTLKRTKSTNVKQIIEEESLQLLAAAPKNTLIIALDEHGKEWTTLELTKKLDTWHNEQQDISLLIGGPDGLSPECLQKAQTIWSLSKLTLPHQLVKIFIAEQIYRAWSIINKHPYHRN
ncbi:23S rRNA m(3)psi1915 methyltransferase [Gammaproteobacteria bacterium]